MLRWLRPQRLRRAWCPCPSCNHLQRLRWRGLCHLREPNSKPTWHSRQPRRSRRRSKSPHRNNRFCVQGDSLPGLQCNTVRHRRRSLLHRCRSPPPLHQWWRPCHPSHRVRNHRLRSHRLSSHNFRLKHQRPRKRRRHNLSQRRCQCHKPTHHQALQARRQRPQRRRQRRALGSQRKPLRHLCWRRQRMPSFQGKFLPFLRFQMEATLLQAWWRLLLRKPMLLLPQFPLCPAPQRRQKAASVARACPAHTVWLAAGHRFIASAQIPLSAAALPLCPMCHQPFRVTRLRINYHPWKRRVAPHLHQPPPLKGGRRS